MKKLLIYILFFLSINCFNQAAHDVYNNYHTDNYHQWIGVSPSRLDQGMTYIVDINALLWRYVFSQWVSDTLAADSIVDIINPLWGTNYDFNDIPFFPNAYTFYENVIDSAINAVTDSVVLNQGLVSQDSLDYYYLKTVVDDSLSDIRAAITAAIALHSNYVTITVFLDSLSDIRGDMLLSSDVATQINDSLTNHDYYEGSVINDSIISKIAQNNDTSSVSGGGEVDTNSLPVANQIAYFTAANKIGGSSDFLFTGDTRTAKAFYAGTATPTGTDTMKWNGRFFGRDITAANNFYNPGTSTINTLSVSGAATLNGNTTLGNAATDLISVTGRLKASTNRWKLFSDLDSNNSIYCSTIINDTLVKFYDDIVGDGSSLTDLYYLTRDGIKIPSYFHIAIPGTNYTPFEVHNSGGGSDGVYLKSLDESTEIRMNNSDITITSGSTYLSDTLYINNIPFMTKGTSNYSIGIGSNCDYPNATTGDFLNVAIGASVLTANQSGQNNIGLGQSSLTTNTSGDYNTAIQKNALTFNTTGTDNIAIGYNALYSNTTGSYSIGIGENAGYFNTTQSNRLYINSTSTNHTNIEGDTTGSIIYGLMADDPSDQQLYLNSNIKTSEKTTLGDSQADTTIINGWLKYEPPHTNIGIKDSSVDITGGDSVQITNAGDSLFRYVELNGFSWGGGDTIVIDYKMGCYIPVFIEGTVNANSSWSVELAYKRSGTTYYDELRELNLVSTASITDLNGFIEFYVEFEVGDKVWLILTRTGGTGDFTLVSASWNFKPHLFK